MVWCGFWYALPPTECMKLNDVVRADVEVVLMVLMTSVYVSRVATGVAKSLDV